MSLLTGMNDILKNEEAMESANDMLLFEEELALEADEFVDAMVDGDDEEDDDIDLMEEEDEEDDDLNEGLDDEEDEEGYKSKSSCKKNSCESSTYSACYEEIAMEGAMETLRKAVIKLCDSLWRKCTSIAGKSKDGKKREFFSGMADKFYNLSKKCEKANKEDEIKRHQKDAEKLAKAVDKALETGEDLKVSLNSAIESPEYKMMEAASEAFDVAKFGYEMATEAAALTGQSFLQSLLLNDDPITTQNGSIGYQDSSANHKDNYSNEFDDADDPITTMNGTIGQRTTAANHKDNYSSEFTNDDDKITTKNGSVGPTSSTPNPTLESAVFFGDLMGEEYAMEGLIKNFKSKQAEKKNAKRAELLSKMGVSDIDSAKFDELRQQGKIDQVINAVTKFGKKLEEGLKKLEDNSEIKAARRIIKTNAALLISLQIDKNAAEYVKAGMSEKEARKKAKAEMKKKSKSIEDPAQESYITDCLNMLYAFEASVGQGDTMADHSDNYSDGELDDSDPVTTEDGEDVGDDNAVANPANESDIDEELRLLNESLLGDIEDTQWRI